MCKSENGIQGTNKWWCWLVNIWKFSSRKANFCESQHDNDVPSSWYSWDWYHFLHYRRVFFLPLFGSWTYLAVNQIVRLVWDTVSLWNHHEGARFMAWSSHERPITKLLSYMILEGLLVRIAILSLGPSIFRSKVLADSVVWVTLDHQTTSQPTTVSCYQDSKGVSSFSTKAHILWGRVCPRLADNDCFGKWFVAILLEVTILTMVCFANSCELCLSSTSFLVIVLEMLFLSLSQRIHNHSYIGWPSEDL